MSKQQKEEARLLREQEEALAQEKAREERLREREERAAAREMAAAKKLLEEQQREEAAIAERAARKRRREMGGSEGVSGSVTPKVASTEIRERWEVACEVCRKTGWNIVSRRICPRRETYVQDEDEDLVSCDDCGRWQHTECHDRVDAAQGRPKRKWDEVDFQVSLWLLDRVLIASVKIAVEEQRASGNDWRRLLSTLVNPSMVQGCLLRTRRGLRDLIRPLYRTDSRPRWIALCTRRVIPKGGHRNHPTARLGTPCRHCRPMDRLPRICLPRFLSITPRNRRDPCYLRCSKPPE
jgi:hypothetical protein